MPTFRRQRSSITPTHAPPCLSSSVHSCDSHTSSLRTSSPCPIIPAASISTSPPSSFESAQSPTRVPINDCCRGCETAWEYGLRPDDAYTVRWSSRGKVRREQQLREARPVNSPFTPLLSSASHDDTEVAPEAHAASLNVDEVTVIMRRRNSSSDCPAFDRPTSPPMLARPSSEEDTTGPLRRASSTPVAADEDESDVDAPPLLRRQTHSEAERTAFGKISLARIDSGGSAKQAKQAKRGRLGWRSLLTLSVPQHVVHY